MSDATTPPGTDDPAVIVGRDGRAGRMTLNRPATLNALTQEMVDLINAALDDFEADDTITTIIIDAAGERAFCAGGDIRAIYDAALTGDDAPRRFWADEYRLNARMANFPKPIVSIMHGIVMGGGVGVSAHCSHRIVTDSTVVAMPEVSIGFSPDVGATWLLTRLDGELGTHAALTGTRLGAADAITVGLADHYVPGDSIGALLETLAITDVDDAIAQHRCPDDGGSLEAARSWIDDCYGGDDAAAIVTALRGSDNSNAQAAADQIERNSPTAVSVALHALRRGRDLDSLEACLDMEFRIATHFFEGPEFVEGIRAAVIDKDRSPTWQPPTLDAVTPAAVATYFEPQPDDIHLSGA